MKKRQVINIIKGKKFKIINLALTFIMLVCLSLTACNVNNDNDVIALSLSPFVSSDKVYYSIMTENSDTVYLRQKSFGDYTGKGFKKASQYDDSEQSVGGLFWTAKALSSNGYEKYEFVIKKIEKNSSLYVPTYITGVNSVNDTTYFSDSNAFAGFYYSYDYVKDGLAFLDSDIISEQSRYFDHVKEQYLKIDEDYKEQIKSIVNIEENGQDLIGEISTYVKNHGIYNFNFGAYPSDSDVVLHFLTQAKEGICQHFASSAVMIYRAYGIPARYCTGFRVNTQGGLYVDVVEKNAHAWVEVYIENTGWVTIEVTPPAPDVPVSPGGQAKSLTITTATKSKIYDGAPLFDLGVEITKGTLLSGHSIKVLSYPTITNVETVVNELELQIVDASGKDVTDKYNLIINFGHLSVGQKTLYVKTSDVEKVYDGTPIVNGDKELENINGIIDGHKIVCVFDGVQNGVGESDNSISKITVYDENDTDVTKNYYITTEYGKLIGKNKI